MITVNIGIDDEDKYQTRSNDKQWNTLLEVIRNDPLRQLEKKRKAEAEKYIVMATKLIAPVVEAGFAEGYNWCIEQVRHRFMDMRYFLHGWYEKIENCTIMPLKKT